jgi:hypothetical protein
MTVLTVVARDDDVRLVQLPHSFNRVQDLSVRIVNAKERLAAVSRLVINFDRVRIIDRWLARSELLVVGIQRIYVHGGWNPSAESIKPLWSVYVSGSLWIR